MHTKNISRCALAAALICLCAWIAVPVGDTVFTMQTFALFLTLFTMGPTLTQIQTEAYEPYLAEEINQEEFIERAQVPLKDFMVRKIKINSSSLMYIIAVL